MRGHFRRPAEFLEAFVTRMAEYIEMNGADMVEDAGIGGGAFVDLLANAAASHVGGEFDDEAAWLKLTVWEERMRLLGVGLRREDLQVVESMCQHTETCIDDKQTRFS
jgi:hypothetical protein